jgi:hypothetical protein
MGVPGRHQYDWSPHSCTGRVRSESGFSENRINNLADLGTFPHRGVVEIQGLGEKLSLELSNLRNIDWRKIAEALIDIGLVPGSRHRDWNLITESGIEGRRRNARLAGPILLSVPKTSSMSAWELLATVESMPTIGQPSNSASSGSDRHNSAVSHCLDIAHWWLAKEAPVLAIELARAFVADLERRTCRIQFTREHPLPRGM